jgi:lambda repressor-like predicted transcriptional regulator
MDDQADGGRGREGHPTALARHVPGGARRSSPPRWFSSAPIREFIYERRAAGQGLNVIADLAGINRRRLQRVLARERLRSDAADALAVALGRHPCELWPDWFEEGTL